MKGQNIAISYPLADWGQDESSADRRLSGFQGGFNPVRRLVVKKSITDERSISRY
jgi:hypothetical protein